MNPLIKTFKAGRELGLTKLFQYFLYQAGLRSGYYRLVMPSKKSAVVSTPKIPPYEGFPTVSQAHQALTLNEGDRVIRGQFRQFGDAFVPLNLEIGSSTDHWTKLARNTSDDDLKLIWEPARFSWAAALARAYAYSGDPRYVTRFWELTDDFLNAHPPNLGSQWQSAQEVAIRLMMLIFCDRIFATAQETTLENRQRLWQAIAEHAQRILPTLVYARAQHNNHLLSEAAGLYCAGLYLADYPSADKWRTKGWQLLNWGFQNLINIHGGFCQHSTNYHRLMLQIALFCDHLRREADQLPWEQVTEERLKAATRWLWALTDPETGRVPNLGANDGAYLFPLTVYPFDDHRPVVEAAAKAFLNQDVYQQVELSEMAAWFDLTDVPPMLENQPQAMEILRLDQDNGRAFLRTSQYVNRPSHADQLHADLWWQGVNIALDAGTYRYQAKPPWDNAFMATQIHNTLTVDGRDQMVQAGRFLWLDWAQSEVLSFELDDNGRLGYLKAEHDGYRKIGVRHQRAVCTHPKGWNVVDAVAPNGSGTKQKYQIRLTWLLPDWEWSVEKSDRILLTGPDFSFKLRVKGADELNLFRAGEQLLGGIKPDPVWGWHSPTYDLKKPALMLMAVCHTKLPIKLQSKFRF